MKKFYGKYMANIFGVASSVSSAMYLLLIFFAGINTMLIPSVFLNDKVVNFQLISITSQILHIFSVAFLFLFYIKYFSRKGEEKLTKMLAIVFSSVTVALTCCFSFNPEHQFMPATVYDEALTFFSYRMLTFLSYSIEHLFMLTTVNGVLLSVFLFIVCLAQFYYISGANNTVIILARVVMTISILSIILLVFSASTYYGLTSAVMLKSLGRGLSSRKGYAVSFIIYVLNCFMQIVQFVLMYVAENITKKDQLDLENDDL